MFEIWFRESDASNPDVMFFCSRCGCAAESHPIDSQWAQREHQRRSAEAASREALRSSRRKASAAAGGPEGRSGSGEDPLASHFRELGIKPGATLQEVRAPKKQPLTTQHGISRSVCGRDTPSRPSGRQRTVGTPQAAALSLPSLLSAGEPRVQAAGAAVAPGQAPALGRGDAAGGAGAFHRGEPGVDGAERVARRGGEHVGESAAGAHAPTSPVWRCVVKPQLRT